MYIDKWLGKTVGVNGQHYLLVHVDENGMVLQGFVEREISAKYAASKPAAENWQETKEKLGGEEFLPWQHVYTNVALAIRWRHEYV